MVRFSPQGPLRIPPETILNPSSHPKQMCISPETWIPPPVTWKTVLEVSVSLTEAFKPSVGQAAPCLIQVPDNEIRLLTTPPSTAKWVEQDRNLFFMCMKFGHRLLEVVRTQDLPLLPSHRPQQGHLHSATPSPTVFPVSPPYRFHFHHWAGIERPQAREAGKAPCTVYASSILDGSTPKKGKMDTGGH